VVIPFTKFRKEQEKALTRSDLQRKVQEDALLLKQTHDALREISRWEASNATVTWLHSVLEQRIRRLEDNVRRHADMAARSKV
jgi:hypothetical protein